MGIRCTLVLSVLVLLFQSGCTVSLLNEHDLRSIKPCELFPAGQSAFLLGTGTSNDPYLICNVAQFVTIAGDVENMSKSFALMSDLDLTNYYLDGGAEFVIGDNTDRFNGKFYGNGHEIIGFKVLGLSQSRVGLFGVTDVDSEISNLSLECEIENQPTNLYYGCLAGVNFGSVSNVTVSGALSATTYVGGMIGQNNGSVTDSSSSVEIVADGGYVGGLIGSNLGDLTRVSASGSITADLSGSDLVGGLLGSHATADVVDSFATGDIIAAHNYVGGFAGRINSGEIRASYATGSILDTDSRAGGFVGDTLNGSIVECYASGDVTATNMWVGGFVGYHKKGSIDQSYASGHVTGLSRVGGFAGMLYAIDLASKPSVSESFSTGDVTGTFTSDSQIGTFVGFEIEGEFSETYFSNDAIVLYGAAIPGGNTDATGSFDLVDFQGVSPVASPLDGFDLGVWTLLAGELPVL